MERKKKITLSSKQKKYLEILQANFGIVSLACKALGISRGTHYNWVAKNEEFAQRVADIEESTIDFAESKLVQNINQGDTTSIIFFLKTKGKKRGYVERQELTGAEGGSLNVKADIDLSKLSSNEIVELARLNDKVKVK